jgi:uncharacterized protein
VPRARPFLVGVANLGKTGPRREYREGAVAGLAVSGSSVPAGAPVEVDVLLEPVHGGVLASGTVSAPWEGECRRCLGPAVGRLVVEVRELYESRSDGEETYCLSGDQLDLEPLARDAVLVELPPAPLCSEGCQGLCPTCGASLNDGPCGCEPDRTPD